MTASSLTPSSMVGNRRQSFEVEPHQRSVCSLRPTGFASLLWRLSIRADCVTRHRVLEDCRGVWGTSDDAETEGLVQSTRRDAFTCVVIPARLERVYLDAASWEFLSAPPPPSKWLCVGGVGAEHEIVRQPPPPQPSQRQRGTENGVRRRAGHSKSRVFRCQG